jgi:hypothetical protein
MMNLGGIKAKKRIKIMDLDAFCENWFVLMQRGRDSNPRYVAVYTLSRRAPSTTRTPLCIF